jgi:ubiquinone/menaquinone biosynthesis C-methylase UbiE
VRTPVTTTDRSSGAVPATRESPHSAFSRARREHWDAIADRLESWTGWGGYYQRRLAHVYRQLIPPGARILEIGCGQGDLLARLEPSFGLGVDFSARMIERAAIRHPHLHWVVADAHELELKHTFDAIILSDLVNDVWDVHEVLQRVVRLASPRTKIILNTYSRIWEPVLAVAQAMGLSKPSLLQNWLTVEDIIGLLNLVDADVIRYWADILCPLPLPLVATLANRYLVKLWPFRLFALTSVMVAHRRPQITPEPATVSVVVPARNEAGNISRIFAEVPEMGAGTELIFVEGGSTDDTYAAIEREMVNQPARWSRLLRQTGTGKGDAVRLGFEAARGEILMILDADLTVPPDDLRRFYDALWRGKGEFINGVRLVYPMEKQAMRFANLVGNKFFSLAFSWLLGQPIKDTLCGTKVFWRVDYERIAANRAVFGDFDPFGDFDLLFGAAKLNLKIVEVPIRYRERTYGTTNIQRWRHGWILLKMVAFAAGKIKFT